jgi:OOP family OmpA-OmpF porin
MKKIISTICILAMPVLAQAQSEYFAGISLGQSKFPNQAQQVANDVSTSINQAAINAGADASTTTATVVQDNKDTAYKIFGGAWLNDNFGYEIGYVDLGKSKFNVNSDTTIEVGVNEGNINTATTANVSSKAFYAALLAGQKFSNKSRVYAKVGLYRASTKLSGSGVASSEDLDSSAPYSFSEKANNTNVLIGLGYTYPITQKIDIRGEAEQFRKVGNDEVGKGNVTLISIGMSYKF